MPRHVILSMPRVEPLADDAEAGIEHAVRLMLPTLNAMPPAASLEVVARLFAEMAGWRALTNGDRLDASCAELLSRAEAYIAAKTALAVAQINPTERADLVEQERARLRRNEGIPSRAVQDRR